MSERYNSTIPLASGRVVERETFGVLGDGTREQLHYEKYHEAMEQVRKQQPWSPENPMKAFAHDLRIEIIERLGINDPQQYSKVKLYTAVGSVLDVYHGIDAFVDIHEDRGVVTVTLDVSIQNKDAWKADILFRLPPDNLDPDLDTKRYLSMIEQVANAVVKKVKGVVSDQVFIDYEQGA